jgi:hypothetical protein
LADYGLIAGSVLVLYRFHEEIQHHGVFVEHKNRAGFAAVFLAPVFQAVAWRYQRGIVRHRKLYDPAAIRKFLQGIARPIYIQRADDIGHSLAADIRRFQFAGGGTLLIRRLKF